LDSDAVFGVKSSLICHVIRHAATEPGSPEGHQGTWFSLERDVVLAPVSARSNARKGDDNALRR
jgi:hypothetical protein